MRPVRALWVLSLLVGLAAIGAAGWGVTRTPLFEMRTLRVSGNRHLSHSEVARLAGLSRSTNVLWLRGSSVADRVERDPWVLRARVSRSLPGTVWVAIVERRPVAVVEHRHSFLLVSGDGVVLGRARAGTRLPLIHSVGVSLTVGTRLAKTPPELIVAKTLPASVRAKVESIHLAPRGFLAITLRSGVEVLYGDATEASAKGRALAGMLSWIRKEGIHASSIDLRAPAAPALVPVGSTPAP